MPNKFMQGFDKSNVSSEEVWELYLVSTNDGDLYRQQIEPILKNLKLKIKKGTYNEELALKLWRHAADNAAQRYTKEYDGGRGRSSFGIFTVPMRNEVAALMQSHYDEELRYAENPAKRIGAAHPTRRSAATHAAPSKRLVRRRKANVKQGYFPNPIIESAHIHGGVFPVTRHGGFAIAQQFRQNAYSRWEGDKEVFRSHDKKAAVELVKFLNQHVAANHRFTVIDIL